MRREPPFHKQTNTSKQAGQVDHTLKDYIARKEDKPKLTFDEWCELYADEIACDDVQDVLVKCWKAAQENV